VGEPARGDEAPAERAQPADAGRLVQPGRAEGGVEEREGAAGVVGGADVHPAVEQDEEAEARPRPYVRGPYAARPPVGQLHQPDSGDLRLAADEASQLALFVRASMNDRHGSSRLRGHDSARI
jgi:hypothetical protein